MRGFFKLWQSVLQKKRAYTLYEEMQGINIEEVSKQNFKALKHRLKTLQGPYSEAMLKLITSKKKDPEILTPEERRFMIACLCGEWSLKHVTTKLEPLLKSKKLLSMEERKRRREVTEVCHTHPVEGHQDHNFFTFGPGQDVRTAHFLDRSPYLIEAEQEKLREEQPHSVEGMWMSDHLHAYRREQISDPILIFGCQYRVYYKKRTDPLTQRVHLEKHCQFVHPDGKIYTQTIAWGQEIFTHPKLELSLVLMTIEKLRLLGQEAWTRAMNLHQLEDIQHLVQVLFHAGICEVHKPAEFELNSKAVRISTRKTHYSALESFEAGNAKFMLCRVLAGDMAALFGFGLLGAPVNPNQKLSAGNHELNLFSAALLSGNLQIIKRYLQDNIDLKFLNKIYLGEQKSITLYPAAMPILLSNPKLLKELILDHVLGKDASDIKILSENASNALSLLKIFIEEGIPFNHKTPHIRYLWSPSSQDINTAFQFTQDLNILTYLVQKMMPESGKELELALGVATKSIPLVEEMLKKGAKINQGRNASVFDHLQLDQKLPCGMKPLFVAIGLDDLAMVKYLVEQGADLDEGMQLKNFEGIGPEKVSEFRGMSAIQLARHFNKTEMVDYLSEILKKRHAEPVLSKESDILSFTLGLDSPKSAVLSMNTKDRIKDHRVCIIPMGADPEGKAFLILNDSRYFSEFTQFPFDEYSPAPGIHEQWLKNNSDEWGWDIDPRQVVWHTVGEFRATVGISETDEREGADKTEYYTKVVLCDFGKNMGPMLRKMSRCVEYMEPVTADNVADIFTDKINSDKTNTDTSNFVWRTFQFSGFVRAMLQHIFQELRKPSPLFQAPATLHTLYETWHRSQHQFCEAARQGALTRMQSLHKTGLVCIERPTPTLKSIPQVNLWVKTEPPFTYSEGAFEAALYREQFAVAEWLVDKIKLNEQHKKIPFDLFQKMAIKGHFNLMLALYNHGKDRYFELAKLIDPIWSKRQQKLMDGIVNKLAGKDAEIRNETENRTAADPLAKLMRI